jgi:hypothetical protein
MDDEAILRAIRVNAVDAAGALEAARFIRAASLSVAPLDARARLAPWEGKQK